MTVNYSNKSNLSNQHPFNALKPICVLSREWVNYVSYNYLISYIYPFGTVSLTEKTTGKRAKEMNNRLLNK